MQLRSNKIHTDIAPNRSEIYRRISPYNRVDELVKTTKSSPDHVQARPGIPCLEMPWKWDHADDEAYAGEECEHPVGIRHIR